MKNSCLSKQDSLGLCNGKSSIPSVAKKVGLRDGGGGRVQITKNTDTVLK